MVIRYFRNVSENDFKESVKKSYSKSEVCRNVGINFYNGTVGKEFDFLVSKYVCDISHFQRGMSNIKYKSIKKICPVCGDVFQTQKGHSREKITCSHSCSNTYFRSGPSNPNWKDGDNLGPKAYRSTCFYYHEKKCVVCGEDKIVEVHHYNDKHNDNRPENLVPLCPTHHQYMHSKFKDEILDIVEKYLETWKKDQITS